MRETRKRLQTAPRRTLLSVTSRVVTTRAPGVSAPPQRPAFGQEPSSALYATLFVCGAPLAGFHDLPIERFNKTSRDEVLDAYVFESVDQVREITESWLHEYNEERPHDSLGRVPPLTFMPRPIAGESTARNRRTRSVCTARVAKSGFARSGPTPRSGSGACSPDATGPSSPIVRYS